MELKAPGLHGWWWRWEGDLRGARAARVPTERPAEGTLPPLDGKLSPASLRIARL